MTRLSVSCLLCNEGVLEATAKLCNANRVVNSTYKKLDMWIFWAANSATKHGSPHITHRGVPSTHNENTHSVGDTSDSHYSGMANGWRMKLGGLEPLEGPSKVHKLRVGTFWR